MPNKRSKLTEQSIEEMCRLARAGLRNVDICKALGIHQSTLYKWLQEPREGLEVKLFDELEKARAERKAFMIQTITKAAQAGTWQAAAWWLERVYPKEFAKPDRYHDEGVQEAVKAVRELTDTIKAQANAARYSQGASRCS